MELSAIELTKRYGSKTAVDHLNVTLTNGVYGLLGANGAGKTTFMRLLCTVQRPTSGKIVLDGKSIWKLGERYRDVLGYLPQHFGYYPDFTALDFLLYVAALKGLDSRKAKRVSSELLEEVGLSGESRRKIKTFSGGMKQRLGIAQAMLNNPYMLFAQLTYIEGGIPFNITCGTLLAYQAILAVTGAIGVAGITLIFSAACKNQMIALVASAAVYAMPLLFPVSETSALFKLIALLPPYHAQFVSLMSVGQMSGVLLYAILAVPAAIILVAIGNMISRRIFAKHQVS